MITATNNNSRKHIVNLLSFEWIDYPENKTLNISNDVFECNRLLIFLKIFYDFNLDTSVFI